MIAHPRALIAVLVEMPDYRATRGKRHLLAAMRALAWSAMLCGYRSYTAIAEWGHNSDMHLVRALGFTRQPACAATFHTVFQRVDRDVMAIDGKRMFQRCWSAILSGCRRLRATPKPTE